MVNSQSSSELTLQQHGVQRVTPSFEIQLHLPLKVPHPIEFSPNSLCSLFLSLHYLSVFCLLNHIFKTRNHRGLPRWSRVKNPPSSAGDTGLIPSQGTKSSHAARQPSPYAATKTQHSHIYFFFLSKKSKL